MGLAIVNRNCPLQLWDEFLHQVELTLNPLHFSRPDPSKSANKEVHGPYDKTLIAPIGTKRLVYDNPAVRASWAPHGTDAFYVGPTPKHYWCLHFYIPTTQRCCIADTWCLYPSHCTIPTISTADLTVLTACDVLRTLRNTIPTSASEAAARSMAIRDLCAIINPTLPSSIIDPRVRAALELRVPPASITRLPGTRVLHPTVSSSPTPASLYLQNVSTSINTTLRARICTTRFVHQQMACNNNPFLPLADKEPDNPTNHAPMDCSSDNVTNTIYDQMSACTEPTTLGNILASQLAPMRPPHPTVMPRILCSGRAMPVSPLVVPTQTRNKSQHTSTPNVPMPIPTAKPT